VGYLRVSGPTQATDGHGLDVQAQDLVDLCRDQSLDLVEMFSDPGAKGALPLGQGPGLLAALQADSRVEADAAAPTIRSSSGPVPPRTP
jgi:hypothetical protein